MYCVRPGTALLSHQIARLYKLVPSFNQYLIITLSLGNFQNLRRRYAVRRLDIIIPQLWLDLGFTVVSFSKFMHRAITTHEFAAGLASGECVFRDGRAGLSARLLQ